MGLPKSARSGYVILDVLTSKLFFCNYCNTYFFVGDTPFQYKVIGDTFLTFMC